MPAILQLVQSKTLRHVSAAHVAIFSLGVLILYVFYLRFLHPLANVPGPFWASLSRLWMAKHSKDGNMPWTMIALHEKYGPLVRTGPNEVSVADPTAIKTIYGAGTRFYKSDWYSVWQGHRKFDLFPERDEKLHGRQRALVSRAYSMTSLKDLEPYVTECVEVFKQSMDTRIGQIVDMGSFVQLFAFGELIRLSDRSPSQADRSARHYWRNDFLSRLWLSRCWQR